MVEFYDFHSSGLYFEVFTKFITYCYKIIWKIINSQMENNYLLYYKLMKNNVHTM